MVAVSIIVPIYNVEKYLDECLKSIQTQSLRDIEVICVDDGSKDNSRLIVEKYASKDSRFKLISKPNAGYGDSMNRGFDAAVGEYVGIVESDDYVDCDMFEVLFNTAKKNNAEIVKSDYYEFTTSKKNKQNYINTVTDPSFYGITVNYKNCPDLFHFRMNTWTGIYLNTFIKENNIRHNLTPGASYQDNGFWFQTLSLANNIIFVNRAFYHYRQDNPNSSINSKGKVYCMCDEYKYIEDFLTDNKEICDDLYGIFYVKKYFNYMYTYKRINIEFKLDFLKRFADEFKEPLNSNKITIESVGDYVYNMICRIVNDPIQFYNEDTIWDLQHKIVDATIKINKIEKTKGYHYLHLMRLV